MTEVEVVLEVAAAIEDVAEANTEVGEEIVVAAVVTEVEVEALTVEVVAVEVEEAGLHQGNREGEYS